MASPNLIERSLELAAERCENLRSLVYRRPFREHPEDEAMPRELFVAFFGVIAETLHEIIGPDWSPEIDAAWRTTLGEIGGIVARSNA
jgi:hypothetical protein